MDYQELFPVPTEWLQDMDLQAASTVREWADSEVMAQRLERREEFDTLLMPAMRKLFVDIGLQGMLLPEEYGGGGLDEPSAVMTLTALLEQVARGDVGAGFVLANGCSAQFALGSADPSALEKAASLACGDEVAFFPLVLPSYAGPGAPGGPSWSGLDYQARAVPGDGSWVLSAEAARPQCSGALASALTVAAALPGGEPGLFLVPCDLQGVEVGEPFRKTGLAASLNADVTLRDVSVPAPCLIAEGTEAFRAVLSRYYVLCSAVTCGALMATYEIVKEWVDTRVIKGRGQVFKENPLVAALLGRIGERMGTSRLLAYGTARLLGDPARYGPAGAPSLFATAGAAFKTVTRSAMEAMDNTMELMGSAGYATEWNLERYWRDVKTLESTVAPETVAFTDMARHYFDLRKL